MHFILSHEPRGWSPAEAAEFGHGYIGYVANVHEWLTSKKAKTYKANSWEQNCRNLFFHFDQIPVPIEPDEDEADDNNSGKLHEFNNPDVRNTGEAKSDDIDNEDDSE